MIKIAPSLLAADYLKIGAEIELDEKVETVGELCEFIERKLAVLKG